MKKFISILSLTMLCALFVACKKHKPVVVESISQLVPENVISTDREEMFLKWGENYKWFESCVVLKNYLDTDSASNEVESITNIFQALEPHASGFDTFVVFMETKEDVTDVNTVHSFWVEDFPLDTADIELTFEGAYNRVMAANYPKPHSRNVVLRKEVGPNDCNPQYIFGNMRSQLYVDAVTGEVTDQNPVFKGIDLDYSFTW